jgi:hypothetical protein
MPDQRRVSRTTPLPRRGTDRAEDLTAWVALAAGLLVLLASGVLGWTVDAQQTARVRAEAVDRTRVGATLLETAPVVISEYGTAHGPILTRASWTAPDGRTVVGMAPAMPGTAAGAVVPVWTDTNGTAVAAPADPAEIALVAVMSGFGLLTSGACALAVLWAAVHRVTSAVNAACWEREWKHVGPQWTRLVGGQ